MTGSRGQATIEAVVLVPLCLMCAWVLVECGSVLRDQLAVSQAAGRAAVAHMYGLSAAEAARAALPAGLRRHMAVQVTSGRVVVLARPRARLLAAIAAGDLRSEVVLAAAGGAA